jgi:hypothetical protein
VLKREVSGWFWDIGQVPVRNFDWLPFTPPLVAVSGPSYIYIYSDCVATEVKKRSCKSIEKRRKMSIRGYGSRTT